MKKVLLILLSLLVLQLAACGDKADQPLDENQDPFAFDSTDLILEEVSDVDESFIMSYAFKKGETIKYRFTSISENDQTIVADTVINGKMNQTITYLISAYVKEVDEENIAEVDVTINSIKLNANSNDKVISFNSDAPGDSAKNKEFSQHSALIKTPFTVRVDKQGQIIDIIKVEKIVNKFLSLNSSLDSVSTEEKNYLKNNITQAALRPLVQNIFRELPKHKIAKDSVWSVPPTKVPIMVYTLQFDNSYKISKVEKLKDEKIAVIDILVKTIITGDDKVTEGGVTYNFTKPTTNAEGKIYFNLDRGFIQKSRTTTGVDLSFTMEAQTPQGKQKGKKTEKTRNINILELL